VAVLMFFLLFEPGTATAGDISFVNEIGMEFILVKPGTYLMGSPLNEPHRSGNELQHRVEIKKAFYMQATEVTLKQWHRIMRPPILFSRKGTVNMPVTRVSYYDCLRFIDKLSRKTHRTYRLPTEEEWEYVCRAGTTTAYSFGDTIDCTKAMFGNNSLKCAVCISHSKDRGFQLDMPAPVKRYPPNPWGFYDMHGNVWEWVADAYHGYLTDEDGFLSSTEIVSGTRVKRGGSWFMYGYYCRSANRAWAHPASKLKTTGFRVVLEVAKVAK